MNRIPGTPVINDFTTLDHVAIGASIIATRSADMAREDALHMQNVLSQFVKSWREARAAYEELRCLTMNLEEAVCILLNETPGRLPIETLIVKLAKLQKSNTNKEK